MTSTCFCHTFIEDYFEYKTVTGKPDCEHYCSFCLGHVGNCTDPFHRVKLVSFLSTFVSGSGDRPKFRAFIKALKAKKKDTFQVGHVPNKFMGPIHALVLQLVAKGIIGIEETVQKLELSS